MCNLELSNKKFCYSLFYFFTVHPFPSVNDIIQSIPASAVCFAKLDATYGYFQLPLDDEASKLTTFILPSRCYQYLRVPMGLSSLSDEWCRHSNHMVEGFHWCRKIVDDILIWPSTPDESRLHSVLRRCEDLHVTLSQCKFQIDNRLKFAGYIVSKDGMQPDPDHVSSIQFSHANRPNFSALFPGVVQPTCFFHAGLPASYCFLEATHRKEPFLSLASWPPAGIWQPQINLNKRPCCSPLRLYERCDFAHRCISPVGSEIRPWTYRAWQLRKEDIQDCPLWL